MSECDDALPIGVATNTNARHSTVQSSTLQALLSRQSAAEPTYSQLLKVAKDALDSFIRTEYMVDNSTWFEKLDKMPHREFHTLSKEEILLELHRERLCGIVAGSKGKLTKEEREEALQAAADLVNTWSESRGSSSAQNYEVPGHHTMYAEQMLSFVRGAVASAMQPVDKGIGLY